MLLKHYSTDWVNYIKDCNDTLSTIIVVLHHCFTRNTCVQFVIQLLTPQTDTFTWHILVYEDTHLFKLFTNKSQ